MDQAKQRISALKIRLLKISETKERLNFTEREIQQRHRQFAQHYILVPPISPNTRYMPPGGQSREREQISQTRRNNTYALNTDFYRSTVFPDTNTGAINLQPNRPNRQSQQNFVQNAEPISIQEPQKKPQQIQKQNMVNEDKLQPKDNSLLRLKQVQYKSSNQNIPLVVVPRQNSFNNNVQQKSNNASGLFTSPVSNETKKLFQAKQPQISLNEVPKETKPTKGEEIPQNTSLFNKLPLNIQKTIILEKNVEPVVQNQITCKESNFTNIQNKNILQTSQNEPVVPSRQQNTLQGTSLDKNKFVNKFTSNLNKQSNTNLVNGGGIGSGISLKSIQKQRRIYRSNTTMSANLPIYGQNKPEPYSFTQYKLQKPIPQYKQEQNNGNNTAKQTQGESLNEEPKKQAQQFAQNYKSLNPSQSKFLKPEPKKQQKQKQNQQKNDEVKYLQVDSPIIQLKNPVEVQLPKPKEQIKKNVELKQANKGQMLGPGRTLQILPFFGASANATPSENTDLATSENKNLVANPMTKNSGSSIFQGSGTNSQSNRPASSLFAGNINTSNLFSANANTPNLFSGINTNAPTLFGNPLAKAPSSEFSQTFLNKASTGLYGGQVSNSLFSQSNGNSLFSGQNNGLFSANNTGSLFGSQSQQQNKEDEGQSEEGDDQPLQAEENVNPELSTGNYDYIQTKIFFKEAICKFRKGKGQVLENITVSLEQFQDSPSVFLLVRLANKVIGFSGRVLPKDSQIRILNNSTRNLQISKILECGEKIKKPELCLLRLQFKDQQSGSKFKEEFQKILKAKS